MKISLKYPCMCTKEEVLPNGTKPEYYPNLDAAIINVLAHEDVGDLYYAVHGENKHILKVWME